MDVTLMQLSASSLALVPVVVGLVAVAKIYIDSRYAPLLSLVLGVAGAFLFPAATAGNTILVGLLIGLTASGLYSGAKATLALQ